MPFFSNLPWREFSYHMTQTQTRLTPQCKKLLYIGGRSHHHPPPSPWLYIMWQWVYLCHSRLGRNVRNEHVFGSSTHLLNKRQEAFLSSPLKKSLPCPICHSSMQRVAKKKKASAAYPLGLQESFISTIITYYVPICDCGLYYLGKVLHIY